MAEEMTKDLLLQQMRSGRQSLEAALANLSPGQMERLATPGGWSVKDVLFHLAWWESHMALWLEEALRGAVPAMPAPGLTWDDIDQVNAQVFQEGQAHSLPDILAALADAQSRALLAVQAAPEVALTDVGSFPWRNQVPLWNMVAANTYWHYAEHADAIDAAARLPGEG
jgi:hypothetical protein